MNQIPAETGAMEGLAPSARWALAGLSLSMLLSSLGISIANVALPTLARAFAAPFQDVQWVVLAYLLASTALVVGAGRLGDIAGRKRLLLGGIVLFTVASALCAAAPTLWLLIAARGAQGLGAAVLMALTMAFVGDTVPKARIGSAMGLLGTMSAVGTALGPSLGGVLVAGFGWRAVFLATVPLGIAALLLARRHLPADREAAPGGSRFDTAGTLLLAATLGSYALAMTLGRGDFGAFNLALLLAAAVAAGGFAIVERQAADPLIRASTFRDPRLSAGLATNALVSTVMMATLVVGPFHLSAALGLPAAPVGFAMAAGPVVSALAGIPAGRVVDRLGTARVTVAGLVTAAAGCVALAALPERFGVIGYIVPLVVVTAGYALFQAANNTAVMSGAGPEHRGVVSGTLTLSRNLGLLTGASAMGAVFAFASSAADVAAAPPAAVAAGTRATFAVAAALIAVALMIVAGSVALARLRARSDGGVAAAARVGP